MSLLAPPPGLSDCRFPRPHRPGTDRAEPCVDPVGNLPGL
ncbi:Hypothetical protein I596_486 [Dokdonella koreensis DS-123]|uniref:Uncharacterized protein n=1 Tax=Dokdonella koreensis DS-123 TaxID=1300342 RepID=A0A167GG84_9GAMM|nr:Hypothetical protein I596_486 [Dokdonella koreensis DS-123]